MALIHKALAEQRQERAKRAEEQAKLAVVEATAERLLGIMEKMQEGEVARCCRLGRGLATKEFIPSCYKGKPAIVISVPPLYRATFQYQEWNTGPRVVMTVNETDIEPVTPSVQESINNLYVSFLEE